jgi:hypothetical protein
MDDKKGKYSAEETKNRFEAALRGARTAGHRPKESLTQKREQVQRKKEKAGK